MLQDSRESGRSRGSAVHDDFSSVITSLALTVGAAAVTALVAQAIRVPVVLGYIVMGLVIGPHVTGLVSDTALIGVLSQLGVILLFFTIGLEFSVRTIARVGLTTLLTVVIELSLIAIVVFGVCRAFGWTSVESIFVALGVSIASTMLVVKGLDEHAVDPRAKELILAMMVVEDLLSILILALLTGIASGTGLSAAKLGGLTLGLAAFLAGMVGVGMLVVPRAIRYVASFKRHDTLVVTSLGVCFAFVWLALRAGYSVALGGFVAGSLIAESGKGHEVDTLVKPYRDGFGAIFFMSIGMTIVPGELGAHWVAALVIAGVLVFVKTIGVTTSAFLFGHGFRRSVAAGLALSQIGELSFIAIGIGTAAAPPAVRGFLLPVVGGASCVTAVTGTFQIRYGDRLSTFVDHKLPRPVARFISFYDAWLERLRSGEEHASLWRDLRRPLASAALDAVLLVAVVIGTASLQSRAAAWLHAFGVGDRLAFVGILLVAVLLGGLFAFGLVRKSIRFARLLAQAVIPRSSTDRDLGRAPRRVLEHAFEIAALLLFGLPIAAVTQPFIPGGAFVVFGVLGVLGLLAGRSLTELDAHMHAGAELIIEVLGRQGNAAEGVAEVAAVLPGLDAISVVLDATSPAVGKSLAELDLRAKTGASVLAITRAGHGVASPSPHDPLHANDVLALTGSDDALSAARVMLGAR